MLSIHPPFFSSSLRDSHAVWSCLLSERERERERERELLDSGLVTLSFFPI